VGLQVGRQGVDRSRRQRLKGSIMLFKVYATRTVTEHFHVIVDALDWEDALEKVNNGQCLQEQKPFEAYVNKLEAHGAKRIDPIEELVRASSR
jgi:hypothetical protein